MTDLHFVIYLVSNFFRPLVFPPLGQTTEIFIFLSLGEKAGFFFSFKLCFHFVLAHLTVVDGTIVLILTDFMFQK